MKRGSEKSGLGFRTSDAAGPVLDVLAVASVATALVGAALAAGGASWRVRAYFSIVGALFDVLFSARFFIDAQRPGSRIPWLDGLSSIVPLTFFSGPFLAGWILGDLGAAAVRGFWLGARPAGAFAVLAAPRLLRAASPWTRARSSGDSDVDADSAAAARSAGRRAAAAAGVAVAMAGAFASEAFLLPGFSRAAREARVAAVSTILAIPEDGERVSAAMAAGAAALRVDGRALLPAPAGASPADYAMVSAGGVEAWFPAAGEIRARGAASALAALASLAAAAGYAAAIFALRRGRPARRSGAGRGAGSGDGGEARRTRPSAMPSGTEELAGILGKRAP